MFVILFESASLTREINDFIEMFDILFETVLLTLESRESDDFIEMFLILFETVLLTL
jgi:hypothetical protein